MQITIDLPKHTIEQIAQRADSQQQTVEQFAKDAILAQLNVYPSQNDRALMAQEIDAYHRLHPELVKTYLGQHVAIFNGMLVDSSDNITALMARINQQYPDDVVLIRQVEEEPERILHFRSNRLVRA